MYVIVLYVHAQIKKFKVYNMNLRDDQSASYCLRKFLSLLPHLTDLRISSCSLHDDFYKDIADQASSFQVTTIVLKVANDAIYIFFFKPEVM